MQRAIGAAAEQQRSSSGAAPKHVGAENGAERDLRVGAPKGLSLSPPKKNLAQKRVFGPPLPVR